MIHPLGPASTFFPVTHSILSAAALRATILPNYPIAPTIDWRLLSW